GQLSGEPRPIEVDGLAVSGGRSPTIHLASQAGGPAVWDERLQAFLPPTASPGVVCVGSSAGSFSTQEAIENATKAASSIAGARCQRRKAITVEATALDIAPAPVLEIVTEGKAFVDLQ